MAVTNQQSEYKKLRSYLNPAFRGKNVTAVLNALAIASAYIGNNSAAVTEQSFISTASGIYLDLLLSNYGIIRPPAVGISDDVFRKIGIQVKNRKQVRDLINNILNILCGDEMTKASSLSGTLEPYNLSDGDTLVVNFDDFETFTVTFNSNQFSNITQASAQEVADAITESLSSQGSTGIAISNNSGNGNYVELLSNTIGPASSVTVLGGRAQNKLLFSSVVQQAGGTNSTQWTISLQPGGLVRFTWSGGPSPFIGEVIPGNYVNIYGGGFTGTGYEGVYTVVTAVGGSVNESYFEVENILAPAPTSNPITQGGTQSNPTILFFVPVREVITLLNAYAAVYQVRGGELDIFLPASTQTVFRTRLGSAHLHDQPNVIFTFMDNPNLGDQFIITPTVTLIAGIDFAIEPNYVDTMNNLSAAINAIFGLAAIVGTQPVTSWVALGPPNYGYEKVITYTNILTVYQNSTTQPIGEGYAFSITSGSAVPGDVYSNNGQFFTIIELDSVPVTITSIIVPNFILGVPNAWSTIPNVYPMQQNFQSLLVTSGLIEFPPFASGTLTKVSGSGTATIEYSSFEVFGSYFGTANITVSNLNGSSLSVYPDQPGPYVYDLTQPFSVTSTQSDLTQNFGGINMNGQYIFTVTTANATAGTIYSINGADFIVIETISGSTTLVANKINGAIITSAGTLTKLSGTGDSTITFSAYSFVGIDSRIVQVADASQFPNSSGYLIFEYGTENQEGPVPYIGRPSNTTLLISPTYTIQKDHPVGSSLSLVTRGAVTISKTGDDYPFYETDVVAGRVYAQDLITSVAAAGIDINYTIKYPGDIGLGKAGTPYSEIVEIWSEEQ